MTERGVCFYSFQVEDPETSSDQGHVETSNKILHRLEHLIH